METNLRDGKDVVRGATFSRHGHRIFTHGTNLFGLGLSLLILVGPTLVSKRALYFDRKGRYRIDE